MSCTCQNCGRQYNIDVIIHNEMWRLIKPDGADEDGGMLCGSCIINKLEPLLGAFAFKLGIVGKKSRKIWDRRQDRQKIKKWQLEMRKKIGLPAIRDMQESAPSRETGEGRTNNHHLTGRRKMKTCETCENWIDATAECAVAIRFIANGDYIPDGLNFDKNKENNCDNWRNS